MPGDPGMNARATVRAGYDAIVTTFAEWSSAVSDPARTELFGEWLARLPARARLLDIGCGSGTTWIGGLAERFAITGIDISPAQIEAARRNVPAATFIVGDMTTIELADAAFDGIAALYSIAHVPAEDHELVFTRFATWLRPGGLLLASLPAETDPVRPAPGSADTRCSSPASERRATSGSCTSRPGG